MSSAFHIALEKPVVLITGDEIELAPADIRAYEFISYAKLSPDVFVANLIDALQSVLGNPFAGFYAEAVALFQQFCTTKDTVSRRRFSRSLKRQWWRRTLAANA